MANFCKNEDCPTSQVLLAFQNGDIEVKDSADIRRHLAGCEFCAAEVEFYSYYPPADEPVKAEKIPQPLYELAEALLQNRPDNAELYHQMEDESECPPACSASTDLVDRFFVLLVNNTALDL